VPFEAGAVRVPITPGLGATLDREALRRLHEQYRSCAVRQRDDQSEMRKYDPSFSGRTRRC
jgi:glucarate dehydratase